MIKVKLFKQSKGYCGPASLKMALSNYGINKSENDLAKLTKTNRITGCKEENIIKIAKRFGFKAYLKQKSTIKELKSLADNNIPTIVAWTSPEEEGHYSVVVGFNKENIFLADPHFGKIKKYEIRWFKDRWHERSKGRMISNRGVIVIK